MHILCLYNVFMCMYVLVLVYVCVCLCVSVIELFVCSLIKQPVIVSSTCETNSIMCTNHISVILYCFAGRGDSPFCKSVLCV